MPKLLSTSLDLPRCPHCGIDTPNLPHRYPVIRPDFQGNQKEWGIYSCNRCVGVVAARANGWNQEVVEFFPKGRDAISEDVPQKARNLLTQAIDSRAAPSGAVMLAASAVDAMLKAKDLKDGSLFERINQTAQQHLLTRDMAEWAHAIRLEANDQRHADDTAPLPSTEDADSVIEFALALGQFMFVLPARVQRGIGKAKHEPAALSQNAEVVP